MIGEVGTNTHHSTIFLSNYCFHDQITNHIGEGGNSFFCPSKKGIYGETWDDFDQQDSDECNEDVMKINHIRNVTVRLMKDFGRGLGDHRYSQDTFCSLGRRQVH